jgi:secondary thiamine-phosphate synthase enzyme
MIDQATQGCKITITKPKSDLSIMGIIIHSKGTAHMNWFSKTLMIETVGQGFNDFTALINTQIRQWNVQTGIAYLFVQHTSASLVINENYDSSAQRDMEEFLAHIAPEGQNWYQHTLEGLDDSPAHMRSILTNTSLTIPVDSGKLNLGTWQGVYLAEHRRGKHQRRVLLRVLSVTD